MIILFEKSSGCFFKWELDFVCIYVIEFKNFSFKWNIWNDLLVVFG